MRSLLPWILICGAASTLAAAVDQSTINALSTYAPKDIVFHLTAHTHTCLCFSTQYGNSNREQQVKYLLSKQQIRPKSPRFKFLFQKTLFQQNAKCVEDFETKEKMSQAGILTKTKTPSKDQIIQFQMANPVDPATVFHEQALKFLGKDTLEQLNTEMKSCMCSKEMFDLRPDWRSGTYSVEVLEEIQFTHYKEQRKCLGKYKARVRQLNEQLGSTDAFQLLADTESWRAPLKSKGGNTKRKQQQQKQQFPFQPDENFKQSMEANLKQIPDATRQFVKNIGDTLAGQPWKMPSQSLPKPAFIPIP